MSKQEHTKGPWRVWEADSQCWEICEPNNPRRHSHFASVSVGNMWGDEGKANARLIATAPELLADLEWLVEIMKVQGWKDDAACIAAEKTIAKAKGA